MQIIGGGARPPPVPPPPIPTALFLVFCHFPIRCPRSDVAFDCIDSRSLHSSLLSITMIPLKKNKMST